jgi:hypothetical protein
MTIFIDNEEMTYERAIEFISKPDDCVRQIVRVWCDSNISHRFERNKSFKKAVRRNRKTLESPDKIKTLFTPCNYLFSTKEEGKDRQETLYFEDRDAKRTGRLRQQHPNGPLAKIDKKPKIHLFPLSEERQRRLCGSLNKNQRLPRIYCCELRAEDGKHHVEFACEGKSVSPPHRSRGTVETSRQCLECRIASALENILGIRRAAQPSAPDGSWPILPATRKSSLAKAL